ncbi:MAG: hypothetical protein ACNA71_01640 [Kiritimatiellia bacterium]
MPGKTSEIKWTTHPDARDHLQGNTAHKTVNRQSGQALIEICVCMIGIVVILLAMLELTKISMLQTLAMTEARANVARIMQADVVLFPTPDFLQTWDEGPDGKRYTADDVPVTASSASFYQTTIERSVADPAHWNLLSARPNRIVNLRNAPIVPAAHFGLLKGNASETTSLLPGFQRLLYRAETITVESEIWMTWTKGIY